MKERTGIITFQGDPLTLLGEEIGQGASAPEVQLTNGDLETVGLRGEGEEVLIIASVPSIDTSVCSKETKRFNQEAEALPGAAKLKVVSMDLPFAQQRWAKEYEATRITFLSDHREAFFGQAFGVLIKELRLLARAVFVIDAAGKISYMQLVEEVTDEPDYEAALSVVRGLF
ncbi:MAG: thiol peroxidase [Deltaproteobacteria bacterium]|nr:thiol peroxidase [Deltaproteobacteria bacterium]